MSRQRPKRRWDPSEAWPPRWPSAPPGTDPRTLQEIEGIDWGPPTFGSHLVKTCHALRLKPLGSFSVEDLRILIGQSESLPVLVPLALTRLQEVPLAEGDFYPGDLLGSLLELEPSFWQLRPGEHREIREVAERALAALGVEAEVNSDRTNLDLAARLRAFLER
jgi:hypothetical protein